MNIYMKKKLSPAIVDSSALVSLTIDTDSNHIRSLEIASMLLRAYKVIIIPSDIFTETINILGKKFGHSKATQVAYEILTAKEYEITDTTDAIREMALQKFQNVKESVSYTDCIVMACADAYSTNVIFGFDEIFAKNGYKLP